MNNTSTDQQSEKIHEKRKGGFMRGLRNIIIGLLLVVISGLGLFINEQEAAKREFSLNWIKKNAVSLGGATFDEKNNGKLIHISGIITPVGVQDIGDEDFRVGHENSRLISLVRNVEMYQWEESIEKGQAVYKRVWSASEIESAAFRDQSLAHVNPPKPTQSFWNHVKKTKLGSFVLPVDAVQYMPLTELSLPQLDMIVGEYSFVHVSDNPKSKNMLTRSNKNQETSISKDYFYHGKDYKKPEVGDIRISYSSANAQMVTAIGRQDGSNIAPYKRRFGKDVFLVMPGIVSVEGLLEVVGQKEKNIRWVFRLLGLIGMIVGVSLTFSIITTLLGRRGWLARVGRFAKNLAILVFGFALAIIAIGISWLLVHPVIGAPVILLALALVYFERREMKNK